MSNIELSPGIVIDDENDEAYVMSPSGGIVAVSLTEGREVWRSEDAAKPLYIAGDLLLGQAEDAGPANELRIVSLRAREGGSRATESLVPLPPGVQPMIGQAVNRSFVARAQPLDGDMAVSWEFVERVLQGTPPEADEVLPGEEVEEVEVSGDVSDRPMPTTLGAGPGGDAAAVFRGTVRLSAEDGSVTPMVEPHVEIGGPPPPPPAFSHSADLGETKVLSSVPEPQFLSADGRHVMHCERAADDSEWDKYLWTIFDHATGRRVGQFRTHVRYTPFIVANSRVIFRTEPHTRRVGDALVETPLQLTATDMQSGQQVWQQPVRDAESGLPPPP